MDSLEILDAINSDLPTVSCYDGCVDCCGVALWSPEEWRRVPSGVKEDMVVGAVKVPLRLSRYDRAETILPVNRNRVMEIAYRKKMAVMEMTTDQGLLLTSVGLEGISCPFRNEGEGCSVYQYRPFICRIMGCSVSIPRLSCPKGVVPDKPLPDFHINKRFAMWASLLPRLNKEAN